MNIQRTFHNALNAILTLLFPIECLGCHKENTYLCDKCFSLIPLHRTIEPFEHPLKYLDGIWTATDYQNHLVQTAIHYLKFRHIKELAQPLSHLFIEFYKQVIRYPSTLPTRSRALGVSLRPNTRGREVGAGTIHDTRYAIHDTRYTIIPVPLNKKRLLERDFNQAELIGKPFADYFGFEILTNIIKRIRHTPHQVGLNKKQRQINLKNAFKVTRPELIQNKNIILIDDVVTTGSTLEEIAKTLKENGAKAMIGLAVAKD